MNAAQWVTVIVALIALAGVLVSQWNARQLEDKRAQLERERWEREDRIRREQLEREDRTRYNLERLRAYKDFLAGADNFVRGTYGKGGGMPPELVASYSEAYILAGDEMRKHLNHLFEFVQAAQAPPASAVPKQSQDWFSQLVHDTATESYVICQVARAELAGISPEEMPEVQEAHA